MPAFVHTYSEVGRGYKRFPSGDCDSLLAGGQEVRKRPLGQSLPDGRAAALQAVARDYCRRVAALPRGGVGDGDEGRPDRFVLGATARAGDTGVCDAPRRVGGVAGRFRQFGRHRFADGAVGVERLPVDREQVPQGVVVVGDQHAVEIRARSGPVGQQRPDQPAGRRLGDRERLPAVGQRRPDPLSERSVGRRVVHTLAVGPNGQNGWGGRSGQDLSVGPAMAPTMSAESVSRWARRHVAVGAVFLLAWQLAALGGAPRRTAVPLGLYGFVLHTVAGKGYALVPSYFDRSLAVPHAPVVTLPLLSVGAGGLALAGFPATPPVVEAVAAACWALGAVGFAGALLWTVRGNLTGRETGTGDANADRRRVDRFANAFVPVVLAYLLAGAYETVAAAAGLPSVTGTGFAGASHLLAAGVGALLVFAVGFRLLPRFLVSHPPPALVAVVLPAGALGPILLARSLWGGPWFRVGAAAEAVAVVGFALAYLVLFVRSGKRRVGFYGPLAGVLLGVAGVALGVVFAFVGTLPGGPTAHYRLNLLGFLGLTIVGVAYQFYPPGVGTFPGSDDRTALASILALAVGVVTEAAGLLLGVAGLATVGRALAVCGAALYAGLLFGLFAEHYGGR